MTRRQNNDDSTDVALEKLYKILPYFCNNTYYHCVHNIRNFAQNCVPAFAVHVMFLEVITNLQHMVSTGNVSFVTLMCRPVA